MLWKQLNKEQQENYKNYCDEKFGKTVVFCETGEPLYFDKNCCLIKTNELMDILFNYNCN